MNLETLDMSVDALLPLDFRSLDLPDATTRALKRQGITAPTPVQAAVIPDGIAGRDVLARARTGSGKTLAFGLSVLIRLHGGRTESKRPRGLIVVPTRELANQVRTALEPIAESLQLRVTTVYGGTPYDKQIRQLRAGADVVVATPGRLDDLINRGACRLDRVEIVVLDEADHLCDLGFYPAVDAILGQTPADGQRMLLSATLDGDVDRLARRHLRNPVRHEIDAAEVHHPAMTHHVVVTQSMSKYQATSALLEANPRSIVFTRTRRGATRLARQLVVGGHTAVDLHGSLTQRARERNLRKFSTGQADIVVATDVAARGIHVDNVAMVVHYDLPAEAKLFLHRSGRTARAGVTGAVVTMTNPQEVAQVVGLHRSAGVEARHHEERTAPRPMTLAALDLSGTTPPVSSSAGRNGGPRRGSRPQPGRSTAAPRRSRSRGRRR
jgi:superfamily II DNA/RNA helicase